MLDANLDEVVFADEHQIWDEPNRRHIFELCPREHDHCCLCDGIDKNKVHYNLFLTVLDLRGFTRSGGEHVPHIKRLAAVRANIHADFFKLFDIAMKEHGTIRGMHLLLYRESNMSNATGVPVMMPSGRMFEFYGEDEIVAEFGHDEVRGDPETEGEEGRLLKIENYDIRAFDCRRIFTPPNGAALRAKYGARSTPIGAREEVAGATFEGVRTRMASNPAAQTRSRLASTTADSVPDPAPAENRPAAPAARTRVRTRGASSSPSATGTIARTATAPTHRVPNDLNPEDPF